MRSSTDRLPRGFQILAAIVLATGGVQAKPRGKSIVIVVEGPEGDTVAVALARHVKPPSTIEDTRTFRAALSARGTRTLVPAVASRTRDAQLIERARAVATEDHIDGAILIALRKNPRGTHAHVWAIDAHGKGALVDRELAFPASADANEQAGAVWDAVADLVPPAAPDAPPAHEEPSRPPPPPPTPPPLSPDSPEVAALAATSPTDADRGPAPLSNRPSAGSPRAGALLIVQAAMEAGSRHFSYVDRITAALRPYDLFAAPLVSLDAEVYPLAHAELPVLSGLGIVGDYARAFGVASADSNGASVGTSWQSFDIGLRERIPIKRSVIVGVNVGYGAIAFDFDQPNFSAELPTVGYRFLRAGADARILLGRFSVFGGGSYLPVLSTGYEGQLFTREQVEGIEARLGVGYTIARSFDVSLGLAYTRFFYSMNPVPGDANVAGGALDELARFSLGVAYLL